MSGRVIIIERIWPPSVCRLCGGPLQHHSKTCWCLACGWAMNRTHELGKLTA